MNEQLLNNYLELRNEIDEEASKLASMHKTQLNCKKGCDSCCESITIFPIEYFAIQKELENSNKLPKSKIFSKLTKACRFLVKGECSIYSSRPIICRTQGFPLLYENSEGTGYELSVCKLNFIGVNIASFNMENALFMAPTNSKLFLLNRTFIENLDKKYKTTQRIALNNLFER